jgi:hypothetical protein
MKAIVATCREGLPAVMRFFAHAFIQSKESGIQKSTLRPVDALVGYAN